MADSFLVLLATLALGVSDPPDVPTITVDRDNFVIAGTCLVRVAGTIVDADRNGVVHIVGDGITVTFDEPPLRGAPAAAAPDTFEGIGIRISGDNVTLAGAVVNGYRTGIYARKTYGTVIEDCDVSGNFAQRLRSTPEQEDTADWLRPHANDDNEWMNRYGAGVYGEECNVITIRRTRARSTQNGIVLDHCKGAEIYDNDCSFGSGWGIAMWRTRESTISRNACDFRVRGYSHGVYNRGQDSAGILMFEQCRDNVIAENSATHCGDGLFAFAGRDALGEVETRRVETWYRRRGCNDNVIASNDFSYAVAHGIEITFSFGNHVVSNRVVDAAICGLWGGYSQQSFIADNHFEGNGDMPYGLERGGINIEHGFANVIYRNRFLDNACGVHLWWDDDAHLTTTPWGQANSTASESNSLIENTFERDDVAVHLRAVGLTSMLANRMIDVGVEIDADEASLGALRRMDPIDMRPLPIKDPPAPGDSKPIGRHAKLAGREHIVMTEWGPYDWSGPALRLAESAPGRHVYELLGDETLTDATLASGEGVTLQRDGRRIIVAADAAATYELQVRVGSLTLDRTGTLGEGIDGQTD